MAKIELNLYDLYIDTFRDRDTNEEREVVKIDNRLAFKEEFIADLKAQGVQKFKRRTHSGEDIEMEDEE